MVVVVGYVDDFVVLGYVLYLFDVVDFDFFV